MIFSSWFFWIIIIAIIGLVVAIILFFATDVNRLIVYILLGVFILLLILGIVFAIRSYRKPKPKQNFGDRFIPGFSEGRAIAGKTGLSDLRRKITGSTSGALGSAGRGIGRTAKNDRVRYVAKNLAISAALAPIPIASYVSPFFTAKAVRNKQNVQKNKMKNLKDKQIDLQLQQQEQQLQQQQMGGMPQQPMGGIPQQQMGGMPQQQMSGIPQQPMDGIPQQPMGGMPRHQMVPQY